MYKNPFFVSPSAGEPDIAGRTVLDIMRATGLNTGNILFARALQSILAPPDAPVAVGTHKVVRKMGSDHDCIVVAAANWLQPRTDHGEIAATIEASGLPCFVVGLGAQSGSEQRVPELSEGTQRFISVISERSNAISVRGTFTAETLAYYGIQNVHITGCPSLLMMDPVPPNLIKPATTPRRISIAGSRGLPSEGTLTSSSPTHRLSRLIARLIQSDDVHFVAQAELPEIAILLDKICRAEPIRPEWQQFIERYYGMPSETLIPMLREKMRVFFDMPQWLDYLRGRDFVIGTRLHGTIAGLLAGTPSVLIVHDTRTRETAENMAIPVVEAASIKDRIPYEEIFAAADFERFNTGYMTYYHRFREFFECNGLFHRLNPNA